MSSASQMGATERWARFDARDSLKRLSNDATTEVEDPREGPSHTHSHSSAHLPPLCTKAETARCNAPRGSHGGAPNATLLVWLEWVY